MSDSDDEGLTRRERRFLERRQAIMRAAVKVFAERGFHRSTTREIADAADLAVGTIYIYFDSKEDILLEIIDQFMERQQHAPQAQNALKYPYREVFYQAMRTRIGQVDDEYFKMYLAVLPEVLSDPDLRQHYYEKFIRPSIEVGERHVQARIDLGQIEALDDIPLVVRIMHSLWMGMSILMLMGDEEMDAAWKDPERLSRAISSFYFDPVNSKTSPGAPQNADE